MQLQDGCCRQNHCFLLAAHAHNFVHCRFTNGPMGVNNLRKLLPEFCRRAGITSKITGHDLRVTFITRAAAAGIDRHEIMKRTGHRQAASLDAYIDDSAVVAHAKQRRFQDSMCVRTRSASDSSITYTSNNAVSASGLARPLGNHQPQCAVPNITCTTFPAPYGHPVGPPPTTSLPLNTASNATTSNFPVPATTAMPIAVAAAPAHGQELHGALSLFSSGFSYIIQQFRGSA